MAERKEFPAVCSTGEQVSEQKHEKVRKLFTNALLSTEIAGGFNKKKIREILDDVFTKGVFASEVDKSVLISFLKNDCVHEAFSEVMTGKFKAVCKNVLDETYTLEAEGLVLDETNHTATDDRADWFFFDKNQQVSLQKMQAWVAELPVGSEEFAGMDVLEEVGEDIQTMRIFLEDNADWSEKLKQKITDAVAEHSQEEGVQLLKGWEGRTFIHDKERIPNFAFGPVLGITEVKKQELIKEYNISDENVNKRLYNTPDDLHDGRVPTYCFKQAGCDGDKVEDWDNIFAREIVLKLREQGLDIASHAENNLIEKTRADICKTAYTEGGHNEDTKLAMMWAMGRYDLWMDAYKIKLTGESAGHRSHSRAHELRDDRWSSRGRLDSHSARFAVVQRGE